MIVIQNFHTVSALRAWLHNARFQCGGQLKFSDWFHKYTNNRELVVNGRLYRYRDCMDLLSAES